VRREWDPADLIACWTRMDEDRGLVGDKRGRSCRPWPRPYVALSVAKSASLPP
jgi:hypothetical protein